MVSVVGKLKQGFIIPGALKVKNALFKTFICQTICVIPIHTQFASNLL